nr:hypothetical protein [uncultured Bacteroides sp.]
MEKKNHSKLKNLLENEPKLNDLFDNAEKLNMKELLEAQGGVDEDMDEDCYSMECVVASHFCWNAQCVIAS